MRRELIIALVAVIGAYACDPVYTIGARVRLGPPAPDSCVLAAMRQSFGRAPFETVDLHPGSSATRVQISVRDSSGWWPSSNSRLSIEPQKDSALLLEVTTFFMGGARNVPVARQREYIAAATSVLQQVRAACAPASSAQVQCIAGGWGGHPACAAGGS